MERGKEERHVCSCKSCQGKRLSTIAEWHRALNEAIYHAPEKQKRQMAGLEAIRMGWGGVTAIAEITGMGRRAIARGIRELRSRNEADGRNRDCGGGRKKVEKKRRGDPPPPQRAHEG